MHFSKGKGSAEFVGLAAVAVVVVLVLSSFSGLIHFSLPFSMNPCGNTCSMTGDHECSVSGVNIGFRRSYLESGVWHMNKALFQAARSNNDGVWHDPPEDATYCVVSGKDPDHGMTPISAEGKVTYTADCGLRCIVAGEDFGLSYESFGLTNVKVKFKTSDPSVTPPLPPQEPEEPAEPPSDQPDTPPSFPPDNGDEPQEPGDDSQHPPGQEDPYAWLLWPAIILILATIILSGFIIVK